MWTIIGALLIVFLIIPILFHLMAIKEFWYFILPVAFIIGVCFWGYHITHSSNDCPQDWVWDSTNSMCNDPTFTWK
jgi:hypothetical protein